MKKYTLGFIFNESLDQVLLVHKLRPDWQVGMLNGVGGKIEEGEDHFDCIIREVREESSLDTHRNDWIYIGELGAEGAWQMHVFTYIYRSDLSDAQSPDLSDAEKVEWFPVKNLPDQVLSNLHWLVPLALDKIKYQKFQSCSVRYI